MTDNKEMKTLGGYEIVDEKARKDIHVVSEKADEALSLAKGATKAFVYDTYSDMIAELNTLDKAELLVNFHVMIRTVCVPDLWISGVSDEHVEYTYTSNEDFIVDLTEDGIVQVGYFVLSALETQKVELDDYVKKDDYANGNDTYGLVKGNDSGGIIIKNGVPTINNASSVLVQGKENTFRPLTSNLVDYIVKYGLIDNKLEWTEEQKQLARALLGAIGSEDYADSNKTGVVTVNNVFGVTTMNNASYKNTLAIQPANFSEIDKKEQLYRPIVPARLDYAVKKALSDCKLSGDDAWTEEEKAKALDTLGGLMKPSKPSRNSVVTFNGDEIVKTTQLVHESATPWSVPCRDNNGEIATGTPTADNHATTKKYVDDLVNSAKDSISLKDSATGQVYNVRINNGVLEMVLDEEVE